jgi:lipoprotein-releasing system ATP-binding protein
MSNSNKILIAKEIYRDFETVSGVLPVLKGIDLELTKNEFSAITGASGVGKSTLLHILGGLDKPTRGVITISDQSLKNKSEKELAHFRNDKVGFIFQFHYLLNDFDALENVMIPMLVAGINKNEATEKAFDILDQVGLKERIHHKPNQLSGGEQQRVAVARALANNPEIVLADEPSGNLDTATGRKLHELLLKLNEEKNITFLIATHNMELSSECHRRYKMLDGKIHEVN